MYAKDRTFCICMHVIGALCFACSVLRVLACFHVSRVPSPHLPRGRERHIVCASRSLGRQSYDMFTLLHICVYLVCVVACVAAACGICLVTSSACRVIHFAAARVCMDAHSATRLLLCRATRCVQNVTCREASSFALPLRTVRIKEARCTSPRQEHAQCNPSRTLNAKLLLKLEGRKPTSGEESRGATDKRVQVSCEKGRAWVAPRVERLSRETHCASITSSPVDMRACVR